MVVLELKLPIQAYQCMAVLRRVSKNHPIRPTVERDLRSWLKGYYGEKECSYYLSLLQEDQYYIFHGLRLTDKKAFQIDLVILSQRFIFMAEVKNLSKKLIFNKETNHVTKEFNNEEEGISNPILQVKRQKLQFVNWLRKMQMQGLPIEKVVIISKPTTKVETTPDNQQIFNELIYAESLLDKLEELEMKYQKPVFSKRKTSQLVDLLLVHHQIPIPDILQTYKLSKDDIITGVICPKCQTGTMAFYSAKWHCPICGHSSKTAFFQSVDDYFLLLGPTITRRQFAEFLHIDSTFIAGHQLRSLNLPSSGSKRGTIYTLPKNQLLCPLGEKEINAYTIPTR
ncbi:NERD domain-containing protein [Bacillus sp. ISL-40]|uniref:NERD domain-containing protein n=1 Tax=unclassified Bacillus (in: firmicutes) TaxID=185979 RepID=UPI001BEB621E|nr:MULTISPECIES: NERD domain-containing protein [unclassified Bacillus (in: firmicutes)]MBT2699025.1 NERD domain-containing protein [Bacillus sp. ISL-40]MBT2723697.1 NERD domain-containing protein [Bacillus sp. ISL-46]MBT2739472.1 NERD domain-containing protein [Bacillus sp. ISL-77]